MAHMRDNLLLEDNEMEVTDIIKIQALFRGALVRKMLKESREMYELIVKDLEKNDNFTISWRRQRPCIPLIKKKSRRKLNESTGKNSSLQNIENQSTKENLNIDSCQNIFRMTVKPNVAVNQHEYSENSDNSIALQNLMSVETQTSFCDIRTDSNSKMDNKENKSLVVEETADTNVLEMDDDSTNLCVTNRVICTHVKDVAPISISHDSLSDGLNHTHDIEQSLFLSMQNKTLSSESNQETPGDGEVCHKVSREATHTIDMTNDRKTPAPSNDLRTACDNAVVVSTSVKDSSLLTNATSVWDSFSSFHMEQEPKIEGTSNTVKEKYPVDRESLLEMRKNIAMELLWVQQAINSRKSYLKLRTQMQT